MFMQVYNDTYYSKYSLSINFDLAWEHFDKIVVLLSKDQAMKSKRLSMDLTLGLSYQPSNNCK